MTLPPFALLRPLALVVVIGALPAQRALAQAADAAEAAPAQDGRTQLQAALQQGIDLFNNGDFEPSIQIFTQIITAVEQQNAYAPAPYLFRAKGYAQLEEYEAAIEDLVTALTNIDGAPQLKPEIYSVRGEIYMKVGDFQTALPDFMEAAKLDRSNAQYQFNLGKAMVKLGGAAPGEKALTKYLDAGVENEDEQRAEALQLRGLAYGALRKTEKAYEDFAASLEIDPTNHETYFGRSQVAMSEKRFAEAAADLQLSIENYTPQNEEDDTPFMQAYLTRASVFEEMGKLASEADPDAAQQAYRQGFDECERLLALLPETDARFAPGRAATLFRRGVLQRLLGELGDAVKSFSQALQIDPNLGEGYFRRGICFHYLGENRLAIRDFEQAASINFDSPRANLWKGMAWAKLGDYNEAIRAYGQSVAVSDRYTPAYVNRGLAHLQQEDFEKAIADFNEAIRLEPTEALHYYRRGRAFSLAGEQEKAIQSLMNAIEFDRSLAPAYEALAGELQATGQTALAGEYRRRAEQLGL